MPDKGTYTALVSYKDRAKAESRKLPVLPRMLHLNFLGYTLMNAQKRKDAFHYPESQSPNTYDNPRIPRIKDYETCLSGVRDGYIYILYEDYPDLFIELKSDFYGLTNIVWNTADMEKLPDRRSPGSGSDSLRYYPVDINAGVLSIAFSEFQWTGKYIEKIRTDKAYRDSRMQKFDTRKFRDREPQKHIFDANSVQVDFPIGKGDTRPEKVGNGCWIADFANYPETSMLFQHWVGVYDRAKNKYEDYKAGKTDKYVADVFMALDDPFGCADILADEINSHFVEFRELILSIQGNPATQDEAYHLFLHAMTFYQLFYGKNANKNIKKLSELVVSDEFLERLLLKEKRDIIRDRITELRSKLLEFMKSSYYYIPVGDMEFHKDMPLVEVQSIVLNHQSILSQCPYNYDRFISIKHDEKCKSIDDQILEFVKATRDTHPIAKMYTNEIFIDEDRDVEYFGMITSNIMSLLSSLKDDIFKDARTVYNKQLAKYRFGSKRVRGKAVPLFILDKQDLNTLLANIDVDPEKVRFYGGFGRNSKGQSGVSVKELGITQYDDCLVFNTPQGKTGAIAGKFNRFTSSNGFLAISSFLAIYNLTKVLFGENDNKEFVNKVKNVVNAWAILADLTAYTTTYAVKHAKTFLSVKAIAGVGQWAGTGSTALCGLLAILDGVEATLNDDHDAAMAYYCSGAAFIASAGLSAWSLLTGGNIVAFTVGGIKFSLASILLLVALGGVLLAIYLNDTPLESYLKHIILARKAEDIFTNSKLEGKELANRILINKNDIIGKRWADWRDLKQSYLEFLNLNCIAHVEEKYRQKEADLISPASKAFISGLLPFSGFGYVEKLEELLVMLPCTNIRFNSSVEMMAVYIHEGKLVGFNRCIHTPTGKTTVPISGENIPTSWGIVTFDYENGNLLLNIRNDFCKTFDIRDENNIGDKYFLCSRIVNEKGDVLLPHGDNYIINKITPVYTHTYRNDEREIPIVKEFINYLDYTGREDHLILSMEEIKNRYK